MEIIRGIVIKDLGLYIKKEKILILADLHIGFEEALNKQGILVPRFHFKDLIKRLEKLLTGIEVRLVIINGDLKHEFGSISAQEWRETLKCLDFLLKHCEKIILLKGNHDTVLGPIAEKRNVEVRDYYYLRPNKLYITHGDKVPSTNDYHDSKIIIIGHEHPAISFKDMPSDKFKCFIRGTFNNKVLIVMPSLNPITEGTDIRNEELLSPFLHQDLSKFEVYIVADKIYHFSKISLIE